MAEVLRPTPIVFVACQDARVEPDGTLTLTGILNQVTPLAGPDEIESVQFSTIAVWTGGLGAFKQSVELEDPDGTLVFEADKAFSLPRVTSMAPVALLVQAPARAGPYTLRLFLDGVEASQQPITVRPPVIRG